MTTSDFFSNMAVSICSDSIIIPRPRSKHGTASNTDFMSYISPTRFARSVRHALSGFRQASTENNFRIHTVVAVIITIGLFFLQLTALEKAMIIMAMSSVLVLELVNTVVERFVDILEPRVHTYVALIKDLMAAAVLVVTISSILVGLIIFGQLLGR